MNDQKLSETLSLMNNFVPERIIQDLQDWSEDEPGDLAIFIGCTKCPASFQLNNDSAAWAIMGNTTFLEYVRFVQSSKCPACNPEKKEEAK